MAVEYYSPDQENGANRVPVPTQINAVAANAGVPNAIAANAARVRALMAAAELARANTLLVNTAAAPAAVPAPTPVALPVLPVLPSEDVVVVAVEIAEHTNAPVSVPIVQLVLPSEEIVVLPSEEIVVLPSEEIVVVAEIVERTESAAPAPRGLPVVPSAAEGMPVATLTATAAVRAATDVNQPRPAMFVKNKSRRVRPASNRPTVQRELFPAYSSTSTSTSIRGKK